MLDRFIQISRFLEWVLIEHIESKCSKESELQIYSIFSVQARSRNRDNDIPNNWSNTQSNVGSIKLWKLGPTASTTRLNENVAQFRTRPSRPSEASDSRIEPVVRICDAFALLWGLFLNRLNTHTIIVRVLYKSILRNRIELENHTC